MAGARDAVVLTNVDGRLSHGALTASTGESFADAFDFDSTIPGSQGLDSSPSSRVRITGGEFDATLGSGTSPAWTLGARVDLDGRGNSSLTIYHSGVLSSTVEMVGAASQVQISYDYGSGASGAQIFNSGGFGGGVALISGSQPNTLILQIEGGSPLPVGGLSYSAGGQGNPIVGDGNYDQPVTSQVYALGTGGSAEARFNDRRLSLSGVSTIDDVVRVPNETIDLSALDPAAISIGEAGGSSLTVNKKIEVVGNPARVPVFRLETRRC